MNILLIDNASLTPKVSSLYCDPKTGSFAKELTSLGYKITMYGQIVNSNSSTHCFDIKKNNIHVRGYNRISNKIMNYAKMYSLVLPQILETDFVYIFYPSAFKYVAGLCWLLNKPYGLYIRGEKDLTSKSSRLIYKKSSLILTVTNDLTNLIASISPLSSVDTIKPMINFNNKDISYTRRYTIPKRFKILFLARIEKDKGIEELLLALSNLKCKGYLFHLDIVGAGGYLPEVEKLIKTLEIEDIVSVKGVVTDPESIKSLYLQSDLYVLPTYHEGFPRTLYEAMIFGTPIITTFVGSISSIMRNQHNCIEIIPRSVESLETSLEFGMLNYNLMIKYAKNGFYTVSRIFDSTRPSHAEQLNKKLKDKQHISHKRFKKIWKS